MLITVETPHQQEFKDSEVCLWRVSCGLNRERERDPTEVEINEPFFR